MSTENSSETTATFREWSNACKYKICFC